jgi:DHA2 family multidrug resistance protein
VTSVNQDSVAITPAYRWLIVISGLSGTLVVIFSATMINVAVPSIMGAYGVGQDLAQWAATAYIATMVIGQLMNNWLVSAIGERYAFCVLLVLFTIGSLICAVTPNIEVLIIGRIIQGFTAGIVQPLVLATIISVFPEERRGFAIGLFGMGVTMAPSFGPLIGGIVIDALTWRHIFIVPLPLVGFAFLMGLLFLPTRKFNARLPSFDWTGLILLSTGLICLMTAVGNGIRWGWGSNEIIILFMVGFLAATAFVYSQLHSKNPLLDPTLFLNSRFTAAMLIAFVFGAGNFSTNYAIPVFSQTVQGFSATAAGSILVPAGFILVAILPFTGRMADRMSPHYPIMCGLFLFAIANYFMADADVNTPILTMILLTVLSRGGLGFVMPSMGVAATRAVETERLHRAVGTHNFIRQLGGAFGVNVYVVIVESRTAFHSENLTATQTAANPSSREFLGKVEHLLNEAGVAEAVQQPGALDYLGKVIHAQATTFGFQDGFMVVAMLFIFALIPAWNLGRSK